MKNINFLEIFKSSLIGIKLKIAIEVKLITQPYTVYVKKNNSVTNKQLLSHNPKFVKEYTKYNTLGHHTKYDVLKVINVQITDESLIRLTLENGNFYDLELYYNLEFIGNNTYMVKYKN